MKCPLPRKSLTSRSLLEIKSQAIGKEVQFERHVTSHISEGFKHIFNTCLVVDCLMLAKKVVNNYFKCFASRFFSPLEQCIDNSCSSLDPSF